MALAIILDIRKYRRPLSDSIIFNKELISSVKHFER
jgi:hypothetical protein